MYKTKTAISFSIELKKQQKYFPLKTKWVFEKSSNKSEGITRAFILKKASSSQSLPR